MRKISQKYSMNKDPKNSRREKQWIIITSRSIQHTPPLIFPHASNSQNPVILLILRPVLLKQLIK